MFKKNIYDTIAYDSFKTFYKSASAGGILLIIAAIFSTIWANSPWEHSYHEFWEYSISLSIGEFTISHTLHHWINDGLMVIFFFMVGLEIKREFLVGELSTTQKALLPILGAIGGMIVPATIFALFNYNNPELLRGWAIPTATDIAFALGIISLVGNKVPVGLKVFLAALAIVDDIGAVMIIAIFYTTHISLIALVWVVFFLFLLFVANRLQINYTLIYLILGIGLWFAFMASGVHSTIAGVMSAFLIPASSVIKRKDFRARVNELWHEYVKIDTEYVDNLESQIKEENNIDIKQTSLNAKYIVKQKKLNLSISQLSEHQYEILNTLSDLSAKVQPPLQRLEHGLSKWVSLIIMPIFALANCGVDLSRFEFSQFFHPVTIGIVLGLLLGKIIGVYGSVYLSTKFKIASMPDNVNLKQILGVSILCSIGFTMSLFVSNLAYGGGSEYENLSKIGILAASLIAGIVGFWYLDRDSIYFANNNKTNENIDNNIYSRHDE